MNSLKESMRLLEGGIASERKIAVPEALEQYRAALGQLPAGELALRVELLYRIGSVETRLGNYVEAAASFQEMGSDSLDDSTRDFFANSHFFKGIIAIRNGEREKASGEIEKCLVLMPEHRNARLLQKRLLSCNPEDPRNISIHFPAPLETTVYDLFPDIDKYRIQSLPDIKDEYFNSVWQLLKPYTLLPIERFYNIYASCQYIARARIPGDFVECGVYLGGSIIAAAHFCKHFGLEDRSFFLFDTFCGFPDKMEEIDLLGRKTVFSALPHFFDTHFRNIVEENIKESGVDPDRFLLVEGFVENTLENFRWQNPLAYVRLDTDYYESTRLELTTLWPRLSLGGVLIVDDYGHFEGARAATDEFFSKPEKSILFHRTDYSARSAIKTSE